MSKNKKGSMELSVNSIVILVIAIVIMGLILGFIRSKFTQIGGDLQSKEPDAASATPSDPITLSTDSKVISSGDSAIIKVNVYNPTAAIASIRLNSITNTQCQPSMPSAIQAVASQQPKSVAAGEQAAYILSIRAPKGSVPQTYLCQIGVTGITVPGKDFTLTVQ